MNIDLKPLDRVEILTLQGNYIDIVSADSSDMIQRALPRVVVSGCAHSGIINTVNYARQVTGLDRVHAVMGGFHLTGKHFEPVIEPTVQALKELAPDHVIPAHCTGRNAVNCIEREMPGKFRLNMAGTKITFAGLP